MSQPVKDPSPEQISAICLEIRSGWTPEEHMRRLRVDLRPQYPLADGSMQTMSSVAYERHHERGTT